VLPQIEQIEHAARRAADLCGQMLAYAGKRKLSPGRLDLSDLVRDTAALLEVSITKSARLHLDLARELPPVEADATQLRQIVMNLVINAADALGDSVGDIHVATSLTEAGPEFFRDAVENPGLPEMLARIFEPFFTTKFAGRGLGLSAVLGIVRSHRGALFVESAVGVGTRFRLLLPAVAGAAIDAPVPAACGAMDAGLPSLRGTVLLVDDEADVRKIAALALRQCGLTVHEAPDGAAALALCAERGAGPDLILLDLTMPGLSGEETLRRLRRQGATQKVILMSGYSENDATRRCLELGAVAFLPKPFELAALLHLVATHLPADATRPA
jgi:CheY-like chemotaxis protein